MTDSTTLALTSRAREETLRVLAGDCHTVPYVAHPCARGGVARSLCAKR